MTAESRVLAPRASDGDPPVPSRTAWAWARLAGPLLILAVVVWQVGTGPFIDGLEEVDVGSLVLATLIVLPTTLCCAWRWRVIAHGLGVGLPLRSAVASYYRALFLNLALPTGVLGDVHRAVRHGRDVGDLGLGARAVVWDRVTGQVVQVVVACGVLLVVPSPFRSAMPLVVAIGSASAVLLVVVVRILPRSGVSLRARALRATISDVRHVLLTRPVWPGVLVASTLVVVGNTTLFVLAARTAGETAPLSQLVPLALLALLAMGIPLNLAGWGPREGVAAWAFSTAGLGAAAGVSTSVVYGVLVLVATLPGAVVLVAQWRRPGRSVEAASAPTPSSLEAEDLDLPLH